MSRISLSILLLFLVTLSYGQEENKTRFAPKLGVCTSITNHEIVAAAGFDYIEEGVRRFLIPDKPEEEFQKKLSILKKSSIPILACNGFLPGSLKSTGPEIKHDEILEFAETAFRRAEIAKIKYIVFGSGGSRGIPDGFDHDQARTQFISLLKRMGPVAEKYGIIVVIEPLRSGECNFINRVDEGLAIALEVNHPNIQMLGDVYHMMKEGEEPQSYIEARKLLKHTHIAELEKRTAPGLAGDNLVPYLKALKDAGYNGGISIEGGWGPKEEYEKNLILARAYLQGQINTLN